MPLADGFEADSLAGFWLPGHYGTGLYEPGAVVISADSARTGTRSARITVKEGDVEQRGDDGRRVERAELDSGHHPLLGRDVWYGFSFLLPPGFPIVDNRLVLASWKQSDVEGSPLIGQRFRGGRHSLTIRPPGAAGGGKSYPLPDIRLGRWHDMVYHVRYSAGADGRIEVWMNGARVVSYRGATVSEAGADRFYNKVGLYRDRWKEPMTMYVDNYTLGDSFEGVDPSTFDRRP
jgi:Polysaccharide lyase